MRSRAVVGLEAGAVAAFAAAIAALLLRLKDASFHWSLPAAALGGYALADVASGLAHWFCDTFFREDTPLIGRLLIHPFREHHRDPAGMTRHGFLELTGNSALGLLPVMGGAWAARPGPSADAFFLGFGLALFGTNLFHKWAHMEKPPAAARLLQACGLILRPGAHAAHHHPPYKGAYGVTQGWANPLLDRVLK
jgi:hypothetical protein